MTKDDFFGDLECFDLDKETLYGNINPAESTILMRETDNIEDNTTKVDLFRDLERLGLLSWTWDTSLSSRVSSIEITDTPSFTPMEECIKKVSPQASKVSLENRDVSNNTASTQQTTSNKWRESPIYPSSGSTQGDMKKSAQCILALRPRVKVSGVKQ